MPLPHFNSNYTSPDPIYKNNYETYFIDQNYEKFCCDVSELEISNDKIICTISDSPNTGMSNFMKLKFIIINIYNRFGEVIRIDIAKIKGAEYKSSLSWNSSDLSYINVTFNIHDFVSISESDDKTNSDLIVKEMIRDEKLNKLLE